MIAIVILNWNGKQMLRQFLPSVVAHSAGEGEVIVADNGSDDGSAEMLREEFPTVRLLCLSKTSVSPRATTWHSSGCAS